MTNADAMIERFCEASWVKANEISPHLDGGPERRLPWADTDESIKVNLRQVVRAGLEAAVPGILAGTHAELPLEATEAMIEAYWEEDLPPAKLWPAMVSAHLARSKESTE